MTEQEYLEQILEDQTLEEGSTELAQLRERRAKVEELLRARFGIGGPSIKYGGSYKKGTMNRDSYDLDLTCYFAREDTIAGTTLEEIFGNVEACLRAEYWTEQKGSAIRLRSRDDVQTDFHIDVVPGRFITGKSGNVNLHRTTGDKKSLKTNLDVHTSHVQNSGVIPAIRLMKLWARRRFVGIKTFALELLVIDLLDGLKDLPLAEQLDHVLVEFRDDPDGLSVEDPANSNNDLSEMLNASVRFSLQNAAQNTLRDVDQNGWEAVFGPVKKKKAAALASLVAAMPNRPKPYAAG